MSPEQAKGEPLDARTDLFSLGVVVYEMATGAKPFVGQSTAELFVALLTKEPAPVSKVNPAMPAELDGIVAKLLAKEKEYRYQTAEEVLQDLEAVDAQTSHGSSGTVKAAGSGTHAATPAGARPAAQDSTEPGKRAGTPDTIAGGCGGNRAAAGWSIRLVEAPGGRYSGTVPDAATGPSSAVAAKNAIIVADFVNQTGDTVFETTLNQALVVQLGQSPVLDIVSSQHLRQSLQYLGKKADDTITPAIAGRLGSVRASKPSSLGRLPAWAAITSSPCRRRTQPPAIRLPACRPRRRARRRCSTH